MTFKENARAGSAAYSDLRSAAVRILYFLSQTRDRTCIAGRRPMHTQTMSLCHVAAQIIREQYYERCRQYSTPDSTDPTCADEALHART